MTRLQFIDHVRQAQAGRLPPGVSDVKPGEDDGQVDFTFLGHPAPLESGPVTVTALVPDLSAYPKSHEYMVYGGRDTPGDVSNALSNVRGINKKPVSEMLDMVSAALRKAQSDSDGDSQMLEDDGGDEYADTDDFDADDDDADDEDGGYHYVSDHDLLEPHTLNDESTLASEPMSSAQFASDRAFRQRIRADLRLVKAAGFRVGQLGHLLAGAAGSVVVSIRIAKLGISEEAMQAWQIQPTEYLTLLIRFPNGYKTNEQFLDLDSSRLSPYLAMRVVVGKLPKPTLQEVIKAFTAPRKQDHNSTKHPPTAGDLDRGASSIRDCFISKPLKALLEERLVRILRFRRAGLSRHGAEEEFLILQSASAGDHVDHDDARAFEQEVVSNALPDIVRADHYDTAPDRRSVSFPLLAMQFVLRHFVRCTDFCLVCHRKLVSDVEAIKPYVCDRALCLYQYMTLGLGPSIEHEVVSQPYVVDLLVSFCYNSAAARVLHDFPDGLALVVPPVDSSRYNPTDNMIAAGHTMVRGVMSVMTRDSFPTFKVKFNQDKNELIFASGKPAKCPVSRGQWILMSSSALPGRDLHCRVADTTFFPIISIDKPVNVLQRKPLGDSAPATRSGTSQIIDATFQVYTQDFNELSAQGKCLAICQLLDTLPTVIEMRRYLETRHSAILQGWIERISPSAVSLLRWIIASNRACIMQVDGDAPHADTGAETTPQAPIVFGKTQERCYGMKNYMQFRFAMGAPDKEQRFITAVRKNTKARGLEYPTIFAWHGSQLANWHMIIREGLNYNTEAHGRAYGDGVYHAKDSATSENYSRGASVLWPSSVLNVSAALALNEIVNAPQDFVGQKPFYVIKQLDWIQTRYLFVRVSPTTDSVQIGPEVVPRHIHPQDPARTAGVQGAAGLIIPASAIRSGKRAAPLSSRFDPSPPKKLKFSGGAGAANNPVVIDDDDDHASIATDDEDRALLIDEPAELLPSTPAEPVIPVVTPPQTDFVPGSLDFDTLPIMPLPTYATTLATKRLMKELRSLQKIQKSTPLAELGWFIDAEKIENAYQWIVELHSFHTFENHGKQLPLAEDMKKRGVKSVVLEVRFNKDYPFSPPFVRVIRPQFLSFADGGGGHIVIGGAICMELLTNTGWSSVSSMESVLMQIRLAIASEPYARLAPRVSRDYGAGEGAEGYIRACRTHGWEVPHGFKEMAYSGSLR